MIDNSKEYILCAANFYNDGIRHAHLPKNIKEGFVICGRRHHNCIGIFSQMMGFPYSKASIEILRTEEQGFLTSEDRWVDRKEAMKIAKESGQVPSNQSFEELFSEDIY